MKAFCFIFFLFCFYSLHSFSQCVVAPPAPDCNGTEPLVSDGDTISSGITKWYYGSVTTMNSLTLNGGTLVVCGDLTIDKFYMTTGTIFIRNGARFVIGSGIGAGLQFKGDCALYNYGTCEIRRNLSLEDNATALTPNKVINATGSSVFKMPNQYFVINNAYSWFVNNGSAEFWGIITDQNSVASSVCLGNASSTRMAILINKKPDTYVVPAGYACLNVYQYSEFYGELSSSASLFACLGSGHTSGSSCIPFGCQPNNWGGAQVFTNCNGCAALTILSLRFTGFTANRNPDGTIRLQWDLNIGDNGIFTLNRSADGSSFSAIESRYIKKDNASLFTITDKSPLKTKSYYMISYPNPQTGKTVRSEIIKVDPDMRTIFAVYPLPFDHQFFIRYSPDDLPEKILLTDMSGRNIPTIINHQRAAGLVEVKLPADILAGLYILHIKTQKKVISRTVLKK